MAEFRKFMRYKGVDLYRTRDRSAYFYRTDHYSIDADGAPNAYGPNDIGLDYNANAGYGAVPKSWWPDVLVPDPKAPHQPYVQKTGDHAGYYVSQTSLRAPRLSVTDPTKYVDATSVPFIVFPGSFVRMKGTGRMGDFGFAHNLKTGKSSAFLAADVGPSKAALGEVSIKLAENLGGVDVSPRDGSGWPGGEVVYVVFPYSSAKDARARWRVTNDKIDLEVGKRLQAIGGIEAVLGHLGE